MFTKAVLPDTLRAITLISGFGEIQKAYLAGGTALALHIGHRISVDLDFFTQEEFDEEVLSKTLMKIPEFVFERGEWRTVLGKISETKFSLFYYEYPLVGKCEKFEGINIAALADIAAMKIHAIEDRGSKRDFVDVFFLAKRFSLEQMLDLYDLKYKCLENHLYSIVKALGYFEAAEDQEMPKMLVPANWDEIKSFCAAESLRLAREKLGV